MAADGNWANCPLDRVIVEIVNLIITKNKEKSAK